MIETRSASATLVVLESRAPAFYEGSPIPWEVAGFVITLRDRLFRLRFALLFISFWATKEFFMISSLSLFSLTNYSFKALIPLEYMVYSF